MVSEFCRGYNLKKDKIILDVGHQFYMHKILISWKKKFNSLRKEGRTLADFKDEKSLLTIALTPGTLLFLYFHICLLRIWKSQSTENKNI